AELGRRGGRAVLPGREAGERPDGLGGVTRPLARSVVGRAFAHDDDVVGIAGRQEDLLDAAHERREQHGRSDDERDAPRREGAGPAPDEQVAHVVAQRNGHVRSSQKSLRSASMTLVRAPFQAGTNPATTPTTRAMATPSAATPGDMRKPPSGPRTPETPVFPAARRASRMPAADPAPSRPP